MKPGKISPDRRFPLDLFGDANSDCLPPNQLLSYVNIQYGNFSVQNLGGSGVQSVQMGTRQGPSHPRSQIALPEMQILLQIGKRESGF